MRSTDAGGVFRVRLPVELLAEPDEWEALRREYAALFGFSSYADFVLRRRMVKDEATATAFLAGVLALSTAAAVMVSAPLRELLAARLRQPAGGSGK